MSNQFEGVVCPTTPADLMLAARLTRPDGAIGRWPSLDVRPLSEAVSVLFVNDLRADGVFPEELAGIAAAVSKRFGNALHVWYDDRTGFRYSGAYTAGNLRGEFDGSDEQWVRLNDDGEPLTDGPRLREDEFQADEEYETIVNAIQCGFAAIELPDHWPELLELIGTQ